jgi:hypothetical protein
VTELLSFGVAVVEILEQKLHQTDVGSPIFWQCAQALHQSIASSGGKVLALCSVHQAISTGWSVL